MTAFGLEKCSWCFAATALSIMFPRCWLSGMLYVLCELLVNLLLDVSISYPWSDLENEITFSTCHLRSLTLGYSIYSPQLQKSLLNNLHTVRVVFHTNKQSRGSQQTLTVCLTPEFILTLWTWRLHPIPQGRDSVLHHGPHFRHQSW